MSESEAARYDRLAKQVTDPDLRAFYQGKAAALRKSDAVKPENMAEVERLTKAYAAELRRLGVRATEVEFVAEEAR